MSSVPVLICIYLAIGLLAATGAYLFGRRITARKLSDEFLLKVARLESDAALLNEARARAENSNLAKSAFLANMSHELRTPLNGILGLTDILCTEELTHSQRRKIDLINGSSETLLNLLNDILDISKIESGSIDIEKVDIEMHKLMREIYEFWRPIASKKNVNLLFQKQKEVPDRIVSDPTRIRQCLNNLISNALKFTPDGGQVSVKATTAELDGQHMVSFAVQDNGLGIKPEDMTKLFKPFTQAEVNTSRKFGGTGLGLAITKNLCELLGGDVLVRSEVDTGTIFKMSFVADQSTELSRKEQEDRDNLFLSPRRTNLEGLRCLIAEDNPVNMEVLRLLLEPYGMSLVETTNGQETVRALDAQFFDVVLMDLQMPIMGGQEAVRRIRGSMKHYAQIPIVAMTANAMEEDRKACFEDGFSAFLTKPLKRSELVATIDAVVNLDVNAKRNVA
jgi:signal transduction histidine kinase/CheY-like chemotaxis protein